MTNPTNRRPRPAPRFAALATPALLAVLLAAAWALPATAAKEAQAPVVDLKFEKYTLPNGLDVILRRDTRLPLVAVNIWYHVGPANEEAGRTGFAHLFEHMMFQASGHVQEDNFLSILEGAGSSFINGSTDFDRTNYFEDVPSNQLETALWLESDRMGFLLDRLDAQMLARQQEVVRNERRQAVENQPYGLVEEALFHLLFPAGHPYYANVIGSHDDIQAATPGGRARLLPPLLRPEQRQPRHRRRHRRGADEGARGEVLRHDRARPRGAADHGGHAAHHERAPADRHRQGRAAARLPGLADGALLQAGRRRGRRRLARPGGRQGEPSLQEPRLRAEDRAERERAAAVAGARLHLPDHRHRQAGPHRRGARARHRRGAGEAGRRGTDRGGDHRGAQHDLDRHRHLARELRRLQRRGRPSQPVQPLPRRPGQAELGPRPLRDRHAGRDPGVRRRRAAARPARRRVRRAGRADRAARSARPRLPAAAHGAGRLGRAVARHAAGAGTGLAGPAAGGEALHARQRPAGLPGRGPRPAGRGGAPGRARRQRRRPGRTQRSGRLHRLHARRGSRRARRARHLPRARGQRRQPLHERRRRRQLRLGRLPAAERRRADGHHVRRRAAPHLPGRRGRPGAQRPPDRPAAAARQPVPDRHAGPAADRPTATRIRTATRRWATRLRSRRSPATTSTTFYRGTFAPANAALVFAGDLTEAQARALAEKAFGAWSGRAAAVVRAGSAVAAAAAARARRQAGRHADGRPLRPGHDRRATIPTSNRSTS